MSYERTSSSGGFKRSVSTAGGQDKLHHKVLLTIKDIYALQQDFIKYLNMEDILPKFIAKGLLSESEVYTIRNPYLPPNQRIFDMLQFFSNKGPDAPALILECLTEKPTVPVHMYLANKLMGYSSTDSTTRSRSESIINPVVSRKIDNLKFMFADLLMEAHRYIVSSGVQVEEFRIFLSFMSASSSNSSSLFFRDHLPSLSTASTIDQIITIVNENRYWNHFNYHLLEAVVRKFCGKAIQAKLDTYIEQVIEFENTVSLSEYSVNLPQKLTIPDRPDFTRLKTTLTPEYEDWNTYKLMQARALQLKMCDKLDLQEHALLFQTAEVGSIIITWSVPASVVDSIHVHALQLSSDLLEIGIAKIQYSNTTIYVNKETDTYENVPRYLPPTDKFNDTHLYEEIPSTITSYLDSLERTVEEFAAKLRMHREQICRQQTKPRAGSLCQSTSSNTLLSQLPVVPPQRSRSAMCDYPQTTPLGSGTTHIDQPQGRGRVPSTGSTRLLSKGDSEEENNLTNWLPQRDVTTDDSGYNEPINWRTNHNNYH